MKKTISIITLLALLLITLSGCVKVDYTTKINEDGSGEITYIYGMDKAVVESMGETDETAVAEERKKAEEAGYKTEKYEDEKVVGFKATKKVEDITEKSFALEIFGEDVIKNKEESKIKIDKILFWKIYKQKATVDLTEMEDMKDLGITIKYTINLPTKVTKTNTENISKDKKTISWDLKIGETQEIEFKAISRPNIYMDSNNYCNNSISSNNNHTI